MPALGGREVARIVGFDVVDVCLPTFRELDGSDAMHPDPNYSAAYLLPRGRGPRLPRPRVHHRPRQRRAGHGRATALSRDLAGDSPMRLLGPEEGVVHLAVGAVVDAAGAASRAVTRRHLGCASDPLRTTENTRTVHQ